MASVSILEVRPDGFARSAGVTPCGLISRAPDTAPRRNPGVLHNWCLRTGSILGGSEGILLPSRRRGKRDYAPAGQAAPAERRTDRRDVSSRERNKPQAEDKLFDQNKDQVSAEGCSHRRTGRSEERL
jgi:hypothetical protein